jgi:hypothetical protein
MKEDHALQLVTQFVVTRSHYSQIEIYFDISVKPLVPRRLVTQLTSNRVQMFPLHEVRLKNKKKSANEAVTGNEL